MLKKIYIYINLKKTIRKDDHKKNNSKTIRKFIILLRIINVNFVMCLKYCYELRMY